MEAASSTYQQAVHFFSRLQCIFMTDKHNLNIISWDNQDLGSRPPEALPALAAALRGRRSQEPLWLQMTSLRISCYLDALYPRMLCSSRLGLSKNNPEGMDVADRVPSMY